MSTSLVSILVYMRVVCRYEDKPDFLPLHEIIEWLETTAEKQAADRAASLAADQAVCGRYRSLRTLIYFKSILSKICVPFR